MSDKKTENQEVNTVQVWSVEGEFLTLPELYDESFELTVIPKFTEGEEKKKYEECVARIRKDGRAPNEEELGKMAMLDISGEESELEGVGLKLAAYGDGIEMMYELILDDEPKTAK